MKTAYQIAREVAEKSRTKQGKSYDLKIKKGGAKGQNVVTFRKKEIKKTCWGSCNLKQKGLLGSGSLSQFLNQRAKDSFRTWNRL